ncbi:MAG: ribosome biogenesis GTP-binding protein YihA/YsxC [Smithellaceae bacterium]|nr:ribosome biogenesis GTP-binding protein YihA/YsxC [Smithellaceae bacterium]
MKIRSAEFVKSATAPSHYPRENLPEVAFVGRSNVGKSSLINALVQRKNLARTSNTPGRTQLINFFRVNDNVVFVDLPGYGFAKVPEQVRRNWGPMIEDYLKQSAALRLVILILDIRRDPSDEDLLLIEWLIAYGRPFIFVLTKADKLSRNEQIMRKKKIGIVIGEAGGGTILFSARTGEGRTAIWERIAQHAGVAFSLSKMVEKTAKIL